jgi:hypothetical protein
MKRVCARALEAIGISKHASKNQDRRKDTENAVTGLSQYWESRGRGRRLLQLWTVLMKTS